MREQQKNCFSGGEGVSNIAGETTNTTGGGVVKGSGGSVGGEGGDAAPFSPRQRLRRCARRVLGQARKVARSIVGRVWFGQVSKGIAVLLTLLALAWTPRSQQGYDGCLGRGGCRMPDKVDYGREDLLRRLHGLVLLAFFTEMMAKVWSDIHRCCCCCCCKWCFSSM